MNCIYHYRLNTEIRHWYQKTLQRRLWSRRLGAPTVCIPCLFCGSLLVSSPFLQGWLLVVVRLVAVGHGFHLWSAIDKAGSAKGRLAKDTLLLGQPTLWEIATVGSSLFLRIWLDSNEYELGLHYNFTVSLKQLTLQWISLGNSMFLVPPHSATKRDDALTLLISVWVNLLAAQELAVLLRWKRGIEEGVKNE